MKHWKAILYGVAVWAFTLIVALIAFPLRGEERPLFESIMPVALSLVLMFACVRYFKTVATRYAYVGLCLGLIWLAVSLILDAIAFSAGPMKMGLVGYLKDIGLTYLMILIIPLGAGLLIQQRRP